MATRMSVKAKIIGLVALAILCFAWRPATPMSGDDRPSGTPERIGSYAGHRLKDRSLLVDSTSGAQMRLTPYGDHMIRVQVAHKGQQFVPDDALLMVERHDHGGYLVVVDEPGQLTISTGKSDGVSLTLASVQGNIFEVALIPTTLKLTTFGRKMPGWLFNLEADVLSKTIISWLERQGGPVKD